MVARETDRSGAGDRTHGRPLAHVELDLALEAQVPLDHRAGADHDTGLARPARGPTEPATGLVHENAALDARLPARSEEHTSELQSQSNLVCRLLLEKKHTRNKPASRP